ncbi:MAG TPA: SUMF1/EgtB/PvdO family nonheme iron enzyme [Bacteroidia bacterium]|nr:SUMF1/EgtB/PvdO family nonheme iron enzyme [Bacteroidia bacterium]
MNKVYVFVATAIVLAGCSRDKFTRLEKKSIGKDFVKVTDNLYAGSTEVSNKQYSVFLLSLKVAGKEDEFNRYNFDSVSWRKVLGFSEPLVEYYHDHPAYRYYPAVNISYEGAVAYCNWLTAEYAKNPKRKYNKVVFRLPTEGEWKRAARGTSYTIFPWPGLSMRNSRGIYLANFHQVYEADLKDTVVEGERRAIEIITGSDVGIAGSLSDNGIVTTPVKSYFPNRFGVYNMCGNVSEMLSVKGRTKGGNWNSLGYYLRIDAPDEFGGQMMEPSPLVGFRVFAEVVE